MREYTEIEIYRGYDDQHTINNEIGWEEIHAANRLYARLGSAPATTLIASGTVKQALRRLPDEELDGIPDERWPRARSSVADLLSAAIEIRGIGLAVATKIFHLKRPHLIPVLDSFVVKLLQGSEIGAIEKKSRLVEVGLETLEVIRRDLRTQAEAFLELQDSLRDLPIPLTRIRLYDILCWSTEKWDIRGDTNAPFGTAKSSSASQGA